MAVLVRVRRYWALSARVGRRRVACWGRAGLWSAAVSAPGGLALILALLSTTLVCFSAALSPAKGSPTEDGQRSGPSAGPRWRFESLGPEGADIHEVCSVAEGGWAALSSDGSLYIWDRRGEGPRARGWDRIPCPSDGERGRFVHLAPLSFERLAALTSDGGLFVWGPGFTRLGGLPAADAVAAIALLPGAGSAPDVVRVMTRQGEVIEIGPASRSRWSAVFSPGGAPAAAAAFESSPGSAEPPAVPALRSAFVAPGQPESVFALTEWEGLFVSNDGLRSFQPVTGGLPKGVRVAAPSRCETGVLYAASAAEVFVSRDGGAHWSAIGTRDAALPASGGMLALADAAAARGVLFAVTEAGVLLQSRDGGRSWDAALRSAPTAVHAIASDRSEILLGTSRGVLHSADRGRTWEWRNGGLRQLSVSSIAVAPVGAGTLILGTNLGLYGSSDDGVSWDVWPAMFAASDDVRRVITGPVTSVAAARLGGGGRRIAVAGAGGVAIADWCGAVDRGWAWTLLESPARILSVAPGDDGKVWAAGATREGVWIGCADAPDGSARQSGAEAGAWSRAWSQTWSLPAEPAGPLPRVCLNGGSAGREPRLLAGVLRGLVADAWVAIPTPAGCGVLALGSVAPGGPRAEWLGTDAGVYRRAADLSWSLRGLLGERVVEITAAGPGALIARTPDAVYWSRDAGATWVALALPEGLRVTSLALAAENRLLLGTARLGLFAVDAPAEAFVPDEALPVDASPNPFHGDVALRCWLASAADQPALPAGPERSAAGPGAAVLSAPGTGGGALAAAGLTAELRAAVLDGAALAEIAIITVEGQIVRRLRGAAVVAGADGSEALQWVWDGRTEQGLAAPNGIYLVSAMVGPQRHVGRIIKLR